MISGGKEKGFVLSFALFILALYLVVFSQLQSTHLREINGNEIRVWQQFQAARFMVDARMDLNTLLDQQLRLDQNATGVDLFLRGKLPSDLNHYTNLLRYQTGIQRMGMDQNIVAWLDLNRFVGDLNITGRTDHAVVWKQPVNTSRISVFAESSASVPRIIDINITASAAYLSSTAWTLDGNGDTYIRFQYQDDNSEHDFVSTGWGTKTNSYTYTIDFNTTPSSRVLISYGLIDGNNGSVRVDNNNTAELDVSYSIRWQTAADANTVRAGYDFPLYVYGRDINVIETTQWMYE